MLVRAAWIDAATSPAWPPVEGEAMRMNSRYLAAVLALGMGAAVTGCGSDDAGGGEDEQVTLRISTGLSAQHAWWEGMAVPWMERVEELSEGQVEFDAFTGGELVETPDETDALQDGTIDIGLTLPAYLPAQFPMSEVTMLPIISSDAEIAAEAWRNLLESDVELADGKTYFELEYGDEGFHGWAAPPTAEYVISTTGTEINAVSDVQGMSLRTPSRITETYASNIGVNSVTIPAVEMFDALSRGAFDGSFYSVPDWTGYGFQDLFSYTLDGLALGHFSGLLAMRQDVFDDLPESAQDAMNQAFDETFEDGAREWTDRREDVIEYNETEVGGTFAQFEDLDADVQDHLLSGIEETWEQYIELLEADGLPGREVALLWRDLLVEAGAEVPEGIAAME
jgi:TRAP-type C4-dicarboxylate transport system substrate-binding protein